MPTELYDRKTILEGIEHNCLGAVGSSGVIVGGRKIGKTRLLNHVRGLGPSRKESLFCQVFVDDLEVYDFSEHWFLRLLLQELKTAIDKQVAEMAPQEQTWHNELASLATATTTSSQAKALNASIRELDTLRTVNAMIDKLLNSPDTLAPAQTHQIFTELQRIQKRIVLLIDEFHRVMLQPKATNKLFAFLRAGSNSGKILTLVSSPVHLMDPSLHVGADKSYDRLNLFNHFQVQFLEPFTSSEAEGYLDWLGTVDPPLTAAEKQYICELGGGSPHFLRQAWELFSKHRPSTPEARGEFERITAARAFDSDFQSIWANCSPAQQKVLADIVEKGESKSSIADQLEREGYFSKSPAGIRFFSSLFSYFIKGHNPEPAAPVEPAPGAGLAQSSAVTAGKVELIDAQLPTAMGLASSEAKIFRCKVTNDGSADASVTVKCGVTRFGQNTRRQFGIEPGKTMEVEGFAIFLDDRVRKLENPVATNVNYEITAGIPGHEQIVCNGQLPITLLPPNYFLMAVWEPIRQVLLNYTWLIAAWVRRRGKELQQILTTAASTCPLEGYQAPHGTDQAEHTRRQVEAIYDAVKTHGLAYQGSARVYLNRPEYLMQQVRLPEQSLQDKAANCLDMAVLFSSLLSSCEIDPLILFVPGHAIVGWKDGAGGMEFLQTTGIAQNSFAEACTAGMAIYAGHRDACTACLQLLPETIEDPENFAVLIDISAVSRTRQMTKI
jgi:hypothetical protein